MKKDKNYDHVLGAIYATPWAITEPWLENIARIVENRSNPAIAEFKALKSNGDDENNSQLEMVGNVAVIPVMGPIFPRANLMTALSGATSSAAVSDMIDEAMDEGAKAIVFNIDSPGGAIPGGFEVATKIAGLSVPTYAMIEGTGASLAYLWAAQCDMVYCTQGSVVGSVSVVMRMTSDERAMKNEGTDVVTMKSGTLKQSGDPASLAFSGQYQSLLTQLNTYHDMFVSAIASKRSAKMDASKIANGDVWIGDKARQAGLVDGIATLDSVVNKLATRGSASRKTSALATATATISATPADCFDLDTIATAAVNLNRCAANNAAVQGFYAHAMAQGPGYCASICRELLAANPFQAGIDDFHKIGHLRGLMAKSFEPHILARVPKAQTEQEKEQFPAGSIEAYRADASLRAEFPTYGSYKNYVKHCGSPNPQAPKGPAWASVETTEVNGRTVTSYGGGRMTVAAFRPRRKAA